MSITLHNRSGTPNKRYPCTWQTGRESPKKQYSHTCKTNNREPPPPKSNTHLPKRYPGCIVHVRHLRLRDSTCLPKFRVNDLQFILGVAPRPRKVWEEAPLTRCYDNRRLIGPGTSQAGPLTIDLTGSPNFLRSKFMDSPRVKDGCGQIKELAYWVVPF